MTDDQAKTPRPGGDEPEEQVPEPIDEPGEDEEVVVDPD